MSDARSANEVRSGSDRLPAARLALAEGSVFHGRAFGANHTTTGQHLTITGEVVFNTAMSGYQESLTDPSYTGQILVQTAPLMGNTGANPEDVESGRVQVAGFVVRELARQHSNFRATQDLSAYLADHGVLGITGIDTRALTRILRTRGSTMGVLTDDPMPSDRELVERARAAGGMAGQNLVPLVGCSTDQAWSEDLGAWRGLASQDLRAGDRLMPKAGHSGERLRVLAVDCGAKRNILRNLTDRGCEVTVIPHDTPAETIRGRFREGEFDGLFISNGPGDPAAVENLIATLRELIRDPDQTPPTFGICLGHQLLALAAGAKTYKLKFGHRGANQPVLDRTRGRVEITSQNHGFAVDAASLEAVGGEATHIHLNDGTLAGFRLKDRPVFAVQYHPEASPGPHDASVLFVRFVGMMRERGAAAV